MFYEEKIPKAWISITTVLYVAGVAAMAVGTLPDEFGLWLGLSAMFFVLVYLPFNAVPLSKYFFNRIQIDSQTLRVGRERPHGHGQRRHRHAPGRGPDDRHP